MGERRGLTIYTADLQRRSDAALDGKARFGLGVLAFTAVGREGLETMVFTLPSVEVGSILEYRLQIRYDDNLVSEPKWQIQQPFFVHKAHYLFNPARQGGSRIITDSRGQNLNQLMYAVTSVPLEAVSYSLNGRYSVDLSDIPPTPNEDWMPPLNTINQRVEFYYTYVRSGADFWQSEAKRWAKETEHFANPTDQLKKAVAQIVLPADTEEQKARKIYAAVMKLENTDFSRRKSEAERKAEKLKAVKDAGDVWTQQSGTSDQIALLYVALARAANLKVWPMQVVDRSRAMFDPRYLNANQLDDYIAVIEIAAKEIFLDPGQKTCPFGLLHWKHTIAGGFRLTDKGATSVLTPAANYKMSGVQRIANLTLDETGAVTGTTRYIMKGADALRWRQTSLQNDPEEVKKRFNEWVNADLPEGLQADFDHFLGVDDYDTNLMAIVKFTGNLGTGTGKRFFLPGQFFQTRAAHPFVAQDKRISPVDVHYPTLAQDDVTYHLPAGFGVESAPQATDVAWPEHAMLKIVSDAKNDTVEIARTLAYNYTILDAPEYAKLHDFYQKVATADQQQLVLTRTPVAKGN